MKKLIKMSKSDVPPKMKRAVFSGRLRFFYMRDVSRN